jgi:hypothetical protein
MAGQQGKSRQQKEEIGEQRKFVRQMMSQPHKTGPFPEASENQLIASDYSKACQRDGQGMAMKQRDAEQGQREQDEINWNSEKQDWFSQCRLFCSEESNSFGATNTTDCFLGWR